MRTQETAYLVSDELGSVMMAVRGEMEKGIEQLELLLIPRVAGG